MNPTFSDEAPEATARAPVMLRPAPAAKFSRARAVVPPTASASMSNIVGWAPPMVRQPRLTPVAPRARHATWRIEGALAAPSLMMPMLFTAGPVATAVTFSIVGEELKLRTPWFSAVPPDAMATTLRRVGVELKLATAREFDPPVAVTFRLKKTDVEPWMFAT